MLPRVATRFLSIWKPYFSHAVGIRARGVEPGKPGLHSCQPCPSLYWCNTFPWSLLTK